MIFDFNRVFTVAFEFNDFYSFSFQSSRLIQSCRFSLCFTNRFSNSILYKKALLIYISKARAILFYLFDYLVFVNAIILKKANSVYSCQNYLPLTLFNCTRLTSTVNSLKKKSVFRIMHSNVQGVIITPLMGLI